MTTGPCYHSLLEITGGGRKFPVDIHGGDIRFKVDMTALTDIYNFISRLGYQLDVSGPGGLNRTTCRTR